jgi:outer membrane immunogenic protein
MHRAIASFLVILCAASTVDQSASAADLPLRGEPSFRADVFETLPWSGGYVGLHAGMGWAQVSLAQQSGSTTELEGFSGGGQIGYSIQNGRFVFGVELDADATNIEKSESATFGGISAKMQAGVTYLSSLRGRLGVVAGDTLLYGTAGIGWNQSELKVTVQFPGFEVSAKTDTSAIGFVVGGGIEHKFARSLSGRLEALHYGFRDQEITLSGATTKFDTNVTVVRSGLSWHFN